MKITEYKAGKKLICRFRKHDFDLEYDDSLSEPKWYMWVNAPDGTYACDGWIPDSEGWTTKQAMIDACEGALLEPPKRWGILDTE